MRGGGFADEKQGDIPYSVHHTRGRAKATPVEPPVAKHGPPGWSNVHK